MKRARAVAACLSIVLSGWAADAARSGLRRAEGASAPQAGRRRGPDDAAAGESVVRKVAESFDEVPWEPGRWSTATGTTAVSTESHDPGVIRKAERGKSMQMAVSFSGKGFEFFNANHSKGSAIRRCPPNGRMLVNRVSCGRGVCE